MALLPHWMASAATLLGGRIDDVARAFGGGAAVANDNAAAVAPAPGAPAATPAFDPPFPLAPAFACTLWTGDPLETAWEKQRAAVERIQPQVVVAHVPYGGGRTYGRVAVAIRRAVPGVRLWLQVSADPAVAAGVQGLLDTGRRGVETAGVECVDWNAERAFRVAAGAAVARRIVEGWAAQVPRTPQGHTSYAEPANIASYPWSAWLGGKQGAGPAYATGCALSVWQWYPFGDGQKVAIAPGRLQYWAARFEASYRRAVARGWVRASVGRGVYLPSRYVPEDDLVEVGGRFAFATLWPWHGGYDEAALRAAARLAARWRTAAPRARAA